MFSTGSFRISLWTVPKPSKEILEESVENTEKYYINSKIVYEKSIFDFPACSKVLNTSEPRAHLFLISSGQYNNSSVYANIKPSMCLA